jgi:prephenate dehydrogenase
MMRLAIIGVGLIGGSLALALRRAKVVDRVVGLGRSAGNMATALDMGVVDHVASDLAEAIGEADVVFLAVPVGQIGGVMERIAPHLPERAILTDAGSTKQDVVGMARTHLGQAFARFVPGHPIAGAELSGVGAAKADLFRGRQVVLTPLAETDPDAVATVRALWEACGARVSEMTPTAHDAAFAAVSHLPHLLAFALVNMLASRPDAETLLSFAGGGFRDFTRIAASSPEMWRDICMANRQALLAEMKGYRSELQFLIDALEKSDAASLLRAFERASRTRNDWAARGRPRSDE